MLFPDSYQPSHKPAKFPNHDSQTVGAADRCGAILTVDTGAIADNYGLLQGRLGGTVCAAVVKADGYGLGAAAVVRALSLAGCRTFFVADLDEGIALRRHAPTTARIILLHGAPSGFEMECLRYGLMPVLNSLRQLNAWAMLSRLLEKRLPAFIQVDTGMCRLGLSASDIDAAVADGRDLNVVKIETVMSHLACADVPDDPFNKRQLAIFKALHERLPRAPASLAASSACFMPALYHFDLARPGAALYGIAPTRGLPNPMKPVVRLDARILQLRHVKTRSPVGYGRTSITQRPSRLATISTGYADGYLRSGSNRGNAWFGNTPLPLLGRVSMDSIIVDVTAIPEALISEGMLVEIIGPHNPVDIVANNLRTSGYEVLTNLGRRYYRQIIEAEGKAA